jgi:SAM-dependent methyltransferase
MSWVEYTDEEVDFVISTLELKGNEKILDLACGFGRHSLALAARGYSVVGVDITPDYITDARAEAQKRSLNATFICDDIRNISFKNEFDVVLNLADGAIGYFESEYDNMIIFDKIADSLKSGGKSFIETTNIEYARKFFPKADWDAGSKSITLLYYSFNEETKRFFQEWYLLRYGEITKLPTPFCYSARLYSTEEFINILKDRNLIVKAVWGNDSKKSISENDFSCFIYSIKS